MNRLQRLLWRQRTHAAGFGSSSSSSSVRDYGQRGFDAAEPDRLSTTWTTTPTTAEAVVTRQWLALVARSRDLALNNDYAKGFLQRAQTNVVGPDGVALQSQARDGAELDAATNEAVERAWRRWSRAANCDVTGQSDLATLARECVSSAVRNGEFMVRIVRGRQAGPWRFALQVLDPVRCPVLYDNPRPAAGGFIRHGIRFSELGRPLAYLFDTTDTASATYTHGGRAYVEIPAQEILHGFIRWAEGAKRGIPWLATPAARLRQLAKYEQSAVTNARFTAAQAGFLQWEEGYGPELDDSGEPLTMEVEPGTMRELPPGMRASYPTQNFPAAAYAAFQKAQLRGIATGLGVSYNGLANDLSEVNFSSIRQGTLEERDLWKTIQAWIVSRLYRPIFDQWIDVALLSGRIVRADGSIVPASSAERLSEPEWQPRRWQWVDPRADADAAIKSRSALLTSASAIIREQGRDPDTVWREIASEIERMRAAGIPDDVIARIIAPAAAGATQGAQGAANGGANDPNS